MIVDISGESVDEVPVGSEVEHPASATNAPAAMAAVAIRAPLPCLYPRMVFVSEDVGPSGPA
ncbi:hypothetical protein GCM10009655_23490 [Rhodoglobus aureus]|uniref:Uncharacterized protein n=1 Tax=Rhodoglobus aureus TaxID=191497 RepID=A0ABN1VUK2_9MICO